MTNWKLRRTAGLAAAVALLLYASAAVAQAPADPTPLPPLPAVRPPAPAPAAAVPTAETALEQRLRKLEEDNRQVLEMYKAMSQQNAELLKRLGSATAGTAAGAGGGGGGGAGTGKDGEGAEGKVGRNPTNEGIDVGGGGGGSATGSASGTGGAGGALYEGRGATGSESGAGAAGKIGGRNPSSGGPDKRKYVGEEEVPARKGNVKFAEGLEITSDDGEFKFQFHDLTQAELRAFTPQSTGLVHDNFFIPRQRWYITGQATKNIAFYTVINRGYGSLDLLDAFLTFRYDERLRFRAGRMKTPYMYEYYQIAEGDLIAPERSLYAGNLAGNRQMGMMFLGEIFKNRLTYATGVFNGSRRSFEDYNNAKDVYFFASARPFLNPNDDQRYSGAEGTGGRTRANDSPYNKPNQAVPEQDGEYEHGLFDYLNVGGSFNSGYESGAGAQPNVFRTANDQTTSASAATLSPTFLQFNSNVVENGERVQYSGHIAWFAKSLFLLAEYGGGYGTYSLNNKAGMTRLPFDGYNVTATYFLTGERMTRRVNVVKPLSDFKVRNGKVSGTGAVEVYARYSTLNLGRNVFSSGLADPNLWSNQAATIDIGANWYLNFYTKIYFGWQHAMFGDSVTRGSGLYMRDADLFWLRFQLFF